MRLRVSDCMDFRAVDGLSSNHLAWTCHMLWQCTANFGSNHQPARVPLKQTFGGISGDSNFQTLIWQLLAHWPIFVAELDFKFKLETNPDRSLIRRAPQIHCATRLTAALYLLGVSRGIPCIAVVIKKHRSGESLWYQRQSLCERPGSIQVVGNKESLQDTFEPYCELRHKTGTTCCSHAVTQQKNNNRSKQLKNILTPSYTHVCSTL